MDDEEFNRLLLTRILERDHIIDTANTGQEALEKLEERDYDAVLLDIMMPDLNGIETLKIIRDVLDLSTLPIIFISAKDDNQTIIEGIELGANDFIAKPIDPGVVRARLSTHIQLKRLSDERKMTMRALEEANDMKLRMMQIASHDLKNPLNNLALLVSVLNETIGTVPKFPNFMELAMNNIKSMTQIINDFLTANEFIGRQIQIDTDDVSSHDLIHEVLVQYALAAEKKSIDIVLEHVEEAIIFADENRTIQVVN
ncbi:MAG: response regulator, partial [Bacteroidota bacterium]